MRKLILGLLFLLYSSLLFAEEIVVLGQTAPFSGNAKKLGTCYRAGAKTFFDKAFLLGETSYKVKLLSLDDRNEPSFSLINIKRMINKNKVFAIFGVVGAQSSVEIVSDMDSSIPFLMPLSGVSVLFDPSVKNVFTFRPPHRYEIEALAAYLKDKGIKSIGFFYQDTPAGRYILKVARKIFAQKGFSLSGYGSYPRNSLGIMKGLLDIMKAKPDAVFVIGTYRPVAQFIKTAKKCGMGKTIFVAMSTVGPTALRDLLAEYADGVVVSQVVPDPHSSIPIAKEYRENFVNYCEETHKADVNFIGFEGYIAAKIVVEVLNRIKGKITRKNFIKTIENLKDLDIGGIRISYSPRKHWGSDRVYISVIRNGKFVYIE